MTEKKRCVLVVDDHPKVLRFLEIDLRVHGFNVLRATSGKKALELVLSDKPDLMLLDVIMPEMDGFEVIKKLREASRMPVIAFSASPGHREKIISLGASDFMPKPFKADEVIEKISALLDHRKTG